MLMLSRRMNEVIRIGDNISVKILHIHGNQVKLGFDVPKSIPVHREEIYQKILLETNSKTILGQSRDKKVVSKVRDNTV